MGGVQPHGQWKVRELDRGRRRRSVRPRRADHRRQQRHRLGRSAGPRRTRSQGRCWPAAAPSAQPRPWRRIRALDPKADVAFLELDLADLDSVREAAAAFARDHGKLDLLINNAGLMALPPKRTAQGFEMQFGVNHLGHFALTGCLLPQLRQAAGSRVVTVSSTGHRPGQIRFDDLNGDPALPALGRLLPEQAREPALHLRAATQARGIGAPDGCAGRAPGRIEDESRQRESRRPGELAARLVEAVHRALPAPELRNGGLADAPGGRRSAREGRPVLWPRRLHRAGRLPRRRRFSRRSKSRDDVARLWRVSEELTGVVYDLA